VRQRRSLVGRGISASARALLTLLLCLFTALPAHAHKLSYTEAWATFQSDGTFSIDVFMDPRDVPEGAAADNLDQLGQYWNDNLDLQFDDQRVEPKIRIPDANEAAAATRNLTVVRLYGKIPYDAQVFEWSSKEDAGTIVLNLRQQGHQGVVMQRIDPGGHSRPFSLTVAPPRPTFIGVAGTYLFLGFTHIVPKGLDHIAFVLGLFLLSPKLKPLLWQITAFTVAHTATLALASMGWLAVPSSVVEPLIALSIVVVAVENLMTEDLKPWRPILVFAFGLLHGLGFAGVLGEIGLESERFVTSLIGFNIGVELGQLAVVAVAVAMVGRFMERDWYRQRIAIPGSVLIALAGAGWAVERIFLQ